MAGPLEVKRSTDSGLCAFEFQLRRIPATAEASPTARGINLAQRRVQGGPWDAFGVTPFKAIAAGTLTAAVIWVGLNALAVSLPRPPIHRALTTAFDASSLMNANAAFGDARRGASQYNDCVIFSTAYFRAGTQLEDLVTPVYPNLSRVDPDENDGACRMLEIALDADEENRVGYVRYHRYLFGQRGIVAAALQVMSIDSLRLALAVVTHAMAACAIIWGLFTMLRDQRLGLALVLSGTALMFVFGLRYFGQSVAHAPGDFVAMVLLLWMLTSDPHDSQRKSGTLTALALFGGLTAIFEFMIGTLPAGATAVLLGYAWHASRASVSATLAWRNAAYGVSAFIGGFLALFAIKLISAVGVYGPGVLHDFGGHLLDVAGVSPNRWSMSWLELTWTAVNGLGGNFSRLFDGDEWFAVVVVVIAALAALTALLRTRNANAVLYLLAMLAVPAWFILFPDHTARHGWFMARICIWPMIAAGVFFISTLRPDAAEIETAVGARPLTLFP
jgi:hypothetical protein